MKKRKMVFPTLSISLFILILGCGQPSQSTMTQSVSSTQETGIPAEDVPTKRLIKLTTTQGKAILFALNDSSVAKSLYEQLPLSVDIGDYGAHEKIFYPPKKLDTSDTSLAKGPVGVVAYYAPWGNVAIYSGDCGGASGLYQLGQVVSGTEYISQLSGVVRLEAASGNTSSSVSTQPSPTPPHSTTQTYAQQ